jgi:ribonuclease Z
LPKAILKPLLHAKLLNPPFEDPALYLEVLWERRALLLDMGELKSCRPAKLLKVSHAFVSHTHIDHFIGFDTLLRTMLNREKALKVFGPPGFLDRVRGKLSAYTWNLTAAYPFSIRAYEVHPRRLISREFVCQERFSPGETQEEPFSGILSVSPQLQVQVAELDHLIPSLAFAVRERFHLNIRKDRLAREGLEPGSWLKELKEAVWREEGGDFPVRVRRRKGTRTRETEVPLKNLRDFYTISPGQKIAYVTDCRFTPENTAKILSLARGADIFFCEAAFLEKDRARAEERAHLTARQAGELARLAKAGKIEIFHFSPKYEKEPEALIREAEEAFRG